jgi:hypothetical protein
MREIIGKVNDETNECGKKDIDEDILPTKHLLLPLKKF